MDLDTANLLDQLKAFIRAQAEHHVPTTQQIIGKPFPIDNLPNELLLKIGSNLTRRDVLNLRLVSPRLRDFYGSFYTFILRISDQGDRDGTIEQINNFLQRQAVPSYPGFTIIIRTSNKQKLDTLNETQKIKKLILEVPKLLQETSILSKFPKLEELWIKNYNSNFCRGWYRVGLRLSDPSAQTLRNSLNSDNMPVFSQLKRLQINDDHHHEALLPVPYSQGTTSTQQNRFDFKFCTILKKLEVLKIYTTSPNVTISNLQLIPKTLTTLWLCTSYQIQESGLQKILTRCKQLKELMLQYQQFSKTITPKLMKRILWDTEIKKLIITPVTHINFVKTLEPIIKEAQAYTGGRIQRIRRHFRHGMITIKIERNEI